MLGYLFAYIIKKSYSPIELNMKHKLLDLKYQSSCFLPETHSIPWSLSAQKKLLQLKVKDFKLDVSIKIMNDKKT